MSLSVNGSEPLQAEGLSRGVSNFLNVRPPGSATADATVEARPQRRFSTEAIFGNIAISKKLLIAFGATFSAVVLMCATVILCLQILTQAAHLNATSNNVVDDVDRALAGLYDQNASIRGYILYRLPRYLEKYAAAGKLLGEALADARRNAEGNTKVLAQLAEIERTAQTWQTEIGNPAVALGRDTAGFQKAAQITTSEYASVLINKFRDATTLVRKDIDAWSDRAQRRQDLAGIVLLVVVIFGTLSTLTIMGAAWYWLTRSIAEPMSVLTSAMKLLASGNTDVILPALGRSDEVGEIAKAARFMALQEQTRREGAREEVARMQSEVVTAVAQALERLSEGDLAARLETPFAQVYEKLRLDFNAATGKLHDAMNVVRTNTSSIKMTSAEISAATLNLASRTEEQAHNLESTANALAEITKSIQLTAENAAGARDIANRANREANAGGDVVQAAVAAMFEIQKSSELIANITGVIDHVSIQTNLLALNATVEAAHAGESGRGFSIIANEIRGLANLSADAARNIKSLISESTAEIEKGAKLVGKSGAAFERILAQVSDINSAISQIATSASEQASILYQINGAMNEMDMVTQQNAAMVEETTAATQALAGETEQLATLIGHFKVAPQSRAVSSVSGASPDKPTAARNAAPTKTYKSQSVIWEEF